MKQAKLIELGQMLEAWRHQVLSHGRTLTVQELCRLAPMSAHTFKKLKRAPDGSDIPRPHPRRVPPPACRRPAEAGRAAPRLFPFTHH